MEGKGRRKGTFSITSTNDHTTLEMKEKEFFIYHLIILLIK